MRREFCSLNFSLAFVNIELNELNMTFGGWFKSRQRNPVHVLHVESNDASCQLSVVSCQSACVSQNERQVLKAFQGLLRCQTQTGCLQLETANRLVAEKVSRPSSDRLPAA